MADDKFSLSPEDAAFRVFIPDEVPILIFDLPLKMRPVPLAVYRKFQTVLRGLAALANINPEESLELFDEMGLNALAIYQEAMRILLTFYKIEITDKQLESISLVEYKAFLDTQIEVQNREASMVQVVEEKYGRKSKFKSSKSGDGDPEFVAWYSFVEPLKISIMDILATHTEGQLRLMSLASQIFYDKAKRDIDKTSKSNYTAPPKPLKSMTREEIEAYYSSSGF